MAILINFNEMIMCIQRYSLIRNWKRFQFERFNLIFPFLILMSIIVYLPRLFFREIHKKENDNNEFELINTSFKTSTFGIFLDILVSIIRGPICLLIILTINIFTCIEFVKLIKKKKTLKLGKSKPGIF